MAASLAVAAAGDDTFADMASELKGRGAILRQTCEPGPQNEILDLKKQALT